jgi:hypothetical protein
MLFHRVQCAVAVFYCACPGVRPGAPPVPRAESAQVVGHPSDEVVGWIGAQQWR